MPVSKSDILFHLHTILEFTKWWDGKQISHCQGLRKEAVLVQVQCRRDGDGSLLCPVCCLSYEIQVHRAKHTHTLIHVRIHIYVKLVKYGESWYKVSISFCDIIIQEMHVVERNWMKGIKDLFTTACEFAVAWVF